MICETSYRSPSTSLRIPENSQVDQRLELGFQTAARKKHPSAQLLAGFTCSAHAPLSAGTKGISSRVTPGVAKSVPLSPGAKIHG